MKKNSFNLTGYWKEPSVTPFPKLSFVPLLVFCIVQFGYSEPTYSPYADDTYPRQVFWGDTHLHTNMSVDANFSGNLNLGPEEAYRFARGETVVASNGMPAKLRRPLDFLVVTDHSNYLGLLEGLRRSDQLLLENYQARTWATEVEQGNSLLILKEAHLTPAGKRQFSYPPWERSIWQQQINVAEQYNDPGYFTTLIGYEWTSTPNGNNFHRNVIFRDGGDKVGKMLPFSSLDSDNPEDLWAYMERYEQETGGSVLAIPHNPNLSGGMMFPDKTADGTPLSKDYLAARAHWEPLVEVTQYKGNSETHPYLSPEDEFADYEIWDSANIVFTQFHDKWMYQHEYIRSALKLGLNIEAQQGINPYQFGLVGGTDSHTSLSTADENNYFGKFLSTEPKADRWSEEFAKEVPKPPEYRIYGWQLAASGYAAVWATENTREAIFDAMKRRETYATTGPRMVVRMFGGWQFTAGDAEKPDLAKIGYSKGVPMGSVLPVKSDAAAPSFLLSALKDPDGANLDRIQVVKGWRDDKGELHEKVYDVAWSDNRVKGSNGELPAVGNTVNTQAASYSNSIGAVELNVVWQDPDFKADQSAFYYVRVIEVPTPRWTSYDAKYFGLTLPKEVPLTTQERAYTSPIWYSPAVKTEGG